MTRSPSPLKTAIQVGLAAGVSLLGMSCLAALAMVPMPEARSRHLVVLLDLSPTNAPNRCADLRALLDEELRGAEATRDLQVHVFGTGDRTTGDQPPRIHGFSRAKTTFRVEGQRAGALATERTAILKAADDACQAEATRMESPILAGIVGARAALAAIPCDDGRTTCRLVVRTDGLEERDPQVMARLHGKAVGGAASPRVENEHLDVLFCGLADRAVRGSSRPLPGIVAVAEAFRAEVSHPDRVRFGTLCASTSQKPTTDAAPLEAPDAHDAAPSR